MIHELRQALWADGPKGLCLVKFLIDRGIDSDLEWVTIVNETGECWTFSNEDMVFCKNLTQGRRAKWDKPIRRGTPNSMARMLRTR